MWEENEDGTKTFRLGEWEMTATECLEGENCWLGDLETKIEAIKANWSSNDESAYQTMMYMHELLMERTS